MPNRRLIVTQNITLDGVVDATEGWFDPADTEADTADIQEVLAEQTAKEDALLLGRQTFEDFRSYWPKQTDDTTGITDHLNHVRKYVVSSTLDDPQWENTTILAGDWRGEVQALKDRPGQEICLTGSISLAHAVIEAGLVDAYRLFVYPVVLGKGRRLFEHATDMPDLTLIEAKPFRSGVVLLTYRAD